MRIERYFFMKVTDNRILAHSTTKTAITVHMVMINPVTLTRRMAAICHHLHRIKPRVQDSAAVSVPQRVEIHVAVSLPIWAYTPQLQKLLKHVDLINKI